MDADREASLEERIRKLAVDKAHLQLVLDMMNYLNKTPGLPGALENMMHAVLENIGGADASIYYFVDHEIHRASLFRGPEKIEALDDNMVSEVLRQGEAIEIVHPRPDTILRLPEFKHAWSLAHPLKAGEDLIGVFKIDCLHIDTRAMRKVLPSFFGFAAQILKNEILGQTRLQRAYDELTVAHEELSKAKAALEEQVRERTAALEELTRSNAELERRSCALEQANRELESFSYSMSHDLRTPLRAIDGFSRLVLENYGEVLGEEGRRFMALVRQGTGRLAQLIDDLLAFFRLYQSEPALEMVDMAVLAANVAEELLKKEPAGRRIALSVGGLPPAPCDKAMIRQVFLCLIGNALKFTVQRDESIVEVGGSEAGEENAYWVKDNGAGFDPQFAHKLFGVFQRLHGVEEFSGTGMGLAIVKRIVERHGGRVWAEGRVDGGAAFHFLLPRKALEAAAPSFAASPPEGWDGRGDERP